MARDLLPQQAGQGNLGSGVRRWNNTYAHTIYFNGDGSELTSAPSVGSGLFTLFYESPYLTLDWANNDLYHNLGVRPTLVRFHVGPSTSRDTFIMGDRQYPGWLSWNENSTNFLSGVVVLINESSNPLTKLEWAMAGSSGSEDLSIIGTDGSVPHVDTGWRIKFYVYA